MTEVKIFRFLFTIFWANSLRISKIHIRQHIRLCVRAALCKLFINNWPHVNPCAAGTSCPCDAGTSC